MKICIVRYPYRGDFFRGGDYVLFDMIYEALKSEHEVVFYDHERRLVKTKIKVIRKVWNVVSDLTLPFMMTRDIQSALHEFDLILADSSVITKIPFGNKRKVDLLCLVNVDYAAYLSATQSFRGFAQRCILYFKSKIQDSGLKFWPVVSVSKNVASTLKSRNIEVDYLISNCAKPLKKPSNNCRVAEALVYAGSGDYYGKGLDVLEEVASLGFDVHTYCPVSLSGCIEHGVAERDKLLQELSGYGAMLFPSRYESFGLIAVEALFVGLPVVMRRTGVGVELENVLPECVVPLNATAIEWEEAITRVLSDRDRISKIGMEFSKHYVSIERFSKEWLSAINDF